MNKAEKLKRHGVVIRVSVQYNQPWRGFTLQRGHLFGEDEKGYFVSAARPGRRPGTVIVYRCDTSSGDYVWSKTAESVDTETVKRIIQAAHEHGCDIQYEPIERQIQKAAKLGLKQPSSYDGNVFRPYQGGRVSPK